MNKNKKAKQSEEVKDIVERMPTGFGKWVAITVVALTFLLLLFGWLIQYPDTVAGQIRISSSQVPVKLIANTSGKIQDFRLKAREEAKEGDYIAIIQNPASTRDMHRIAALTGIFDPNKESFLKDRFIFPEKAFLGELNLKYYTFLTALKNLCSYEEDNTYEQQEKSLNEDIRWKSAILSQTKENIETTEEKMQISQKWFEKDHALKQKEIVHEYELDRVKSEYLTARQNVQNLRIEASSIEMQLSDSRNSLNRLKIEQKEKEKQMKLDLLSSYHDLADNIKLWEQKYVFKAPFGGKVEFLKFWSENQFVQAGEEVFSIVPEETSITGQVLLPSGGAGKVKPGDPVIIKLDNYPYLEFGSVDGRVNTISLITGQQQTQQASVETYLITVDLPHGLTTNYGETLDFRHEITGTADIVVRDRRFIQRLFDNLRYRTKAK